MIDRVTATIDLDGRTIIVDVIDENGGYTYIDELLPNGELEAITGTSSDGPECTFDTMLAFWTDTDNLRNEYI